MINHEIYAEGLFSDKVSDDFCLFHALVDVASFLQPFSCCPGLCCALAAGQIHQT